MNKEPEKDLSGSVHIDYSRIVSELVARAAQGLADALYAGAKKQADNVKLRLGSTFTRYLDNSLRLRSRVKTILYRQEPQPIYDFYVPHDLKAGETAIYDVDAPAILATTSRALLTGTGGSGKSMLMRHLFIDAMRSKDFIPLFLELRNVNENGTRVADLIDREIDLSEVELSADAVRRGFGRGVFILLLDGLDEVVPQKRDAVSKEIREMARQYQDLPVFVSSRPDERFLGWESFTEFRVQPFTLEKIRHLLGMLRYEEGAKMRFLADVETSLYKTHQSFLSNPLLLTLMLLSYSHHASVPTKRHQFYAEIFETMWSQHDAYKDGFKRHRLTNIDKDDYLRVLEAFSFQTYLDSAIAFETSTAFEYLEKAKKIQQVSFDSQGYLEDLLKNVCILVREGTNITFSHRSFQEYYAARFIRFLKPEVREKTLRAVAARSRQDAVLGLLWEMAPELIERELVVPVLRRLQPIANHLDDDEASMMLAKLLVKRIDIASDSQLLLLGNDPEVSTLWFVDQHYTLGTAKPNALEEHAAMKEAAKELRELTGKDVLIPSEFEQFRDCLLKLFRSTYLLQLPTAKKMVEFAAQLEAKDRERTISIETLLEGSDSPGA